MICSRREFFAGASAFALGAGRLFAAPPGWKPSKKPNLVLGVISDTHLRTMPTSGRIDVEWSDKYLARALGHFRDENVDAVVHCGDFAHLGQVEEMQAHADAWARAFPNNRAPAGHEVVKLFVSGNHELRGSTYGGKGMFVRRLYPDPEERSRHVLASDMAGNWERIWGERYELAGHKVVKGFHFFGAHWKADRMRMMRLVKDALSGDAADAAGPARPFFLLTHSRLMPPERNAIAAFKDRALAFFGHNHESSTNWNTIYYEPNTFPRIQVPPCISPDWDLKFRGEANVTKFPLLGKEKAGRCRQGFLVEVYDDKVVIRRREFAEGGSLGPDWVMPLGEWEMESAKCKVGETGKKCHPFSKESLKKVIGEPQFRKGTKLEVFLDRIDKIENAANHNSVNPVDPVLEDSASLRLCVKIPLADGNPDSRVYAYEVVVAGEGRKLHKAVYAAGCNMGIGHEPNGGVTELSIPKAELPPGDALTIAVRPITSLGTRGKPLAAKWHRT